MRHGGRTRFLETAAACVLVAGCGGVWASAGGGSGASGTPNAQPEVSDRAGTISIQSPVYPFDAAQARCGLAGYAGARLTGATNLADSNETIWRFACVR